MKDLPLSLLSRGCGQFIPSDGNKNGRLDVCFTPEVSLTECWDFQPHLRNIYCKRIDYDTCNSLISLAYCLNCHFSLLNTLNQTQDYYIWKSQDTLLRLSSSGCLLTRQESTLPKTYSTRRGALVLYSQVLKIQHSWIILISNVMLGLGGIDRLKTKFFLLIQGPGHFEKLSFGHH